MQELAADDGNRIITNNNSKDKEAKKIEKASKQVKIRSSTYYELLSLGITHETLDSIIRRALKIAKPIMQETQSKLYKDMASFGVTV